MNYSEYDKKILPLMLLAIVLTAVVLALVLRRRSERIRGIPTAIIAVVLLVLEIFKQRYNASGEFDYFYLPFHYCSLFLLVIPLAELCGARLSRIFRPIAVCMAFVVSGAMYIYPNGIIGRSSELFGQTFYLTHTFIFHHLIVLYFTLTVALRLCVPRVRDSFKICAVGIAYACAAIPLSYELKVNYCNYLRSVIPIMENFRITYGQLPYNLLLTLCISVGMMLCSLLLVGIYKLLSLLKN